VSTVKHLRRPPRWWRPERLGRHVPPDNVVLPRPQKQARVVVVRVAACARSTMASTAGSTAGRRPSSLLFQRLTWRSDDVIEVPLKQSAPHCLKVGRRLEMRVSGPEAQKEARTEVQGLKGERLDVQARTVGFCTVKRCRLRSSQSHSPVDSTQCRPPAVASTNAGQLRDNVLRDPSTHAKAR